MRKLEFITVFTLLLKKSVKSLQLILNEFTLERFKDFSITAGAFTKARKKLKHTAYVELNDDIINLYYEDNDIKRFKGYRLLAFDASQIILPYSQEIKKEFGSRPIGNQTNKSFREYSSAMFEACYDVLNHMSIQSVLAPSLTYEPDLAQTMLSCLETDDLLIFDRGYASYTFMASLISKKRHFIIRCPKKFFSASQSMFSLDAPETMSAVVSVSKTQRKKVRGFNLPEAIRIKFIRVVLSTGEVEVLATSLLNDNEFTPEDFKYLYSLRWGVETFFSKLKGRLGLENFTGKTAESIKQDFWSTIFMSNLETILVEDIETEMNEQKNKGQKKVKVNKAVSFNAIKKMAFEIFSREKDKEAILNKLVKLFTMNPVLVRNNRQVEREKISPIKSLNFQKRARKHVF